MNDFQKCKDSLNFILKKGDLFDVLIKRKNRSIFKFPFIKTNLLLFSRILFLGNLCVEKFSSYFSPVEQVKKAQEQIRKSIGIPVDVFRTKQEVGSFPYLNIEKDFKISRFRYKLFLLYENEGIPTNTYVENLKKIYHFCEQHSISGVLLYSQDVLKMVPDKDCYLSTFKSLRALMGGELENAIDSKNLGFYELTLDQLNSLLQEVDVYQMEKESLDYFKENIHDRSVQEAIDTFLKEGNLFRLKEIVREKFTLLLNDLSGYKDKVYGKMYQNFQIHEEYVQRIVTNKDGKIIEKEILTLYTLLEVQNLEDLFSKLEGNVDNLDLYMMSALYLYLCESPQVSCAKGQGISLYDFYYKCYQKNEKHIPLFYLKSNRIFAFVFQIYGVLITEVVFILFVAILLLGKDFIYNSVSQTKDSTDLNDFVDGLNSIEKYCNKSFAFEKEIFTSFLTNFKDVIPKKQNNENQKENKDYLDLNGDTGDVLEQEKEILATINPLEENITLPTYFAISQAYAGYYNEGNFKYIMDSPNFLGPLSEEDSLFEICYELSNEDLQISLSLEEASFAKTFYPVGNDYVLTGYTITDKKDVSKTFVWDLEREKKGLHLTEKEIAILRSMDTPEICYTYGLEKNEKNSFLFCLSLVDTRYILEEISSEEIRNSILKGLELDTDASLEEIFATIQCKEYSKTPIADAKLSLEQLTQTEYYEAIASLDSLVCNLAAMLATRVDEDLTYVIGYKNTDDFYITNLEAHAWGMYKTGEIVDVTPYEKVNAFNQIFLDILEWGEKYHIGIWGVLLLIGFKLKKVYGKKVVFCLKKREIEKILENPNLAVAYANLMDVLYASEAIPVYRKPSDFAETIAKDFYGYTKEELISIKKELQQRNVLKDNLKLIDNIPLIVENQEKLKRILRKKEE